MLSLSFNLWSKPVIPVDYKCLLTLIGVTHAFFLEGKSCNTGPFPKGLRKKCRFCTLLTVRFLKKYHSRLQANILEIRWFKVAPPTIKEATKKIRESGVVCIGALLPPWPWGFQKGIVHCGKLTHWKSGEMKEFIKGPRSS